MNWIKRNNKKFFTLIELIVVVVVLGILAAIVIPNISSFKEEATETAILSDARNIQTAVDMYGLYSNGATPTKEKATLGNPQIIELYGLQPEYLRKAPKENGAKFWLDANNTVWASMVDAPIEVKEEPLVTDVTKVTLSWKTVDGATLYNIYKTGNEATGNAEAKGMKLVDSVSVKEGEKQSVNLGKLSKGNYLVTALDKFTFESAPTKANTVYKGYGEGPEEDYVLDIPKLVTNPSIPEEPKEPENQKPTAVIGMTPASDINTTTNITWNFTDSTDPESNVIIEAEWKLNGVVQEILPTKLTEGVHTIELRVKDEKESWSNWTSKEITVSDFSIPTQTFNYTGNYQAFTVPHTGTYKLEVWGAEGGTVDKGIGGKGGYAYGNKYLTQGETIYIYVGGKGTKGTSATGGWNGGGSSNGGNGPEVASGGGATDIRTIGGAWSSNLNSRILVAGGGGGGAHYNKETLGGHGGGLIGMAGQQNTLYSWSTFATGGTQTDGGTNPNGAGGSFGRGGSQNTGGGGGGWYGGASGQFLSAGGGGSSYLGGVTNSSTITGVQIGNGMAKISFVE